MIKLKLSNDVKTLSLIISTTLTSVSIVLMCYLVCKNVEVYSRFEIISSCNCRT